MTKAEKIAVMLGKTTYRDLRQGFGGSLNNDGDAEIKYAWGVMAHSVGRECECAFIAKYTASVQHEAFLRRAWWEHARVAYAHRADKTVVHVYRIAGALAVRQVAGLKMSSEMLKEWAWLARVSQPYLAELVEAATRWLDDKAIAARSAFVDALPSNNEALEKAEKAA